MVKVVNFADSFYRPSFSLSQGLEALVRFPDGEFKHNDIPNSTVWVYTSDRAYIPKILGADVGCGIAAFYINEVDPKEATDLIYQKLHKRKILGRGNHFVEVCSRYDSSLPDSPVQSSPHNILLVHTHGDSNTTPSTMREAQERQRYVEKFREELGEELATLIGSSYCKLMGNWTHNFVEEDDGKIIYRKGVVKVTKEKVHILPAHLGARIVFYTVSDDMKNDIKFQMPPYNSMPHATGRRGPISVTKVSLDAVAAMRIDPSIPYIPPEIPDTSLRSEHPSCFNDDDKIFKRLRYQLTEHFDSPYAILLGSCIIKGYVGKV